MARRQEGQLDPPAEQEGAAADEKRVGPLAPKRCEGRIDLAAGVGVDDLDLQSHGAGAASTSLNMASAFGDGRIDEHGDTSGCGHQLAQEFQPLRHQLITEKIDACQRCRQVGQGWRQARA